MVYILKMNIRYSPKTVPNFVELTHETFKLKSFTLINITFDNLCLTDTISRK